MTLPPLPTPDTHCFDEDTGKDVWSHSHEQLLAYGAACAAAEREACIEIVTYELDHVGHAYAIAAAIRGQEVKP